MPVLKNSRHEKFAQLVAKGESANAAYKAVGYAKNDGNAIRLKGNERIQKRIEEIQSEISQSLVAQSIAIKEARVKAANERWLKMHQVIKERAEDPAMIGIPGGQTGLLAHDRKGVGAGPAAEVVDVYEVDAALLKEIRELEMQVSKELGQWVEKGEVEETHEITVTVRHIGTDN